MSKAVATLAIVIVMIGAILVYPSVSASTQEQATPQLLTNWERTGAAVVSNYTVILAVAGGTTYSSLSKSLNATTEEVLTLSWVDSAIIVDATYQLRILENNTVIYSVMSATDSRSWSVGGNSVSTIHNASLMLKPGNYTVLFSLQGTNGKITINSISLGLSIMNFVAQEVEAYAPFLIVVAFGIGVAALASYQSSIKKELEHLETVLRLSK